MNEFDLDRIYSTQLAARVANHALPEYDRQDASTMLEMVNRLMGMRIPGDSRTRTWILSDPHFEHGESVKAFGRPFRNAAHGDDHLFEYWTRDINEHDTVICLGDVSIAAPTNRLVDRLRRTPGRKILIAGNHDKLQLSRLRTAFDRVAGCAHVPGDPDLLLTHVPLDRVPPGTINVHGHVHRKSAVERRRINVCVEQTEYRAVPLSDVLTLARRLEERDEEPPYDRAPTHVHIGWAKNADAFP